MKYAISRFAIAACALLAATTGAAQEEPKERSRTYEGENVSAGAATTADSETGTATRDLQVTNNNTGESVSSDAQVQRTENGVATDVLRTGPQGETRSYSGATERTEDGVAYNRSLTGRDGETVGANAQATRDGEGNASASRALTNTDGETVASRQRARTKTDDEVTRTRSSTRPPRRENR